MRHIIHIQISLTQYCLDICRSFQINHCTAKWDTNGPKPLPALLHKPVAKRSPSPKSTRQCRYIRVGICGRLSKVTPSNVLSTVSEPDWAPSQSSLQPPDTTRPWTPLCAQPAWFLGTDMVPERSQESAPGKISMLLQIAID